MLTSSIHPHDQQQAAAYPLAGFLNKPLKPEGLRTLLQPDKEPSVSIKPAKTVIEDKGAM